MTVRIEPALYNFRLARLYEKWLDDVSDTQSANGAITDTAPFKWGKRPADPVSISYLLAAWIPYVHYGDIEPLRAHYPSFKRWVDYLVSRSEAGILSYSSWGDWAPPQNEAISGSVGAGAVSARTPGDLISTGYLYYHARLLAQIARVLGDNQEALERETLAQEVARAFNAKYWDERVGGYGSNNQACNAFALSLGMVEPARVPRVVANLVQAVDRNGGHLSTGNLCTKYLMEMLTEHGHADVALRIATQTTYPSWGFMLENGATTVWERWEYLTGGAMNSHNHPMLGSVGSWFYKYLAGIRADPVHPGFSRFVIKPYVIDTLQWVEASHRILQGTIRSAWKKDGEKLKVTVTVPENTVATLHLPVEASDLITERGKPLADAGIRVLASEGAGVVLELGSGDYEFEAEDT